MLLCILGEDTVTACKVFSKAAFCASGVNSPLALIRINESLISGFYAIYDGLLKHEDVLCESLILCVLSGGVHLFSYNLAYFSEKIKDDPIQAFPKLLEKAINNMDSLSKWAVNYIHEKKLAEHYSEMESIEKDKLRAQKIAHESQVKAARAQQILLQQQTDAIKAQANAAEQQAKAVQQQARDTEEIKRRLENEKYGDIRRRYAGEKFPWEE